jgi:hypothetical protein
VVCEKGEWCEVKYSMNWCGKREGYNVKYAMLVCKERMVRRKIHCCYTATTRLLDCCYTVVTSLLHCCQTVFTLLLTHAERDGGDDDSELIVHKPLLEWR